MGELDAYRGSDDKNISKLLINTFLKSPAFDPIRENLSKKKIYFDIVPANEESLALLTEYGSYNLSKDVTGTETNIYQFRLVYTSLTGDDATRLDAKQNLDNLAIWAEELEPEELTEIDGERNIVKINIVRTATALAVKESNYIIYELYMSAFYERRRK